jgi:signal transduction histidine kinase
MREFFALIKYLKNYAERSHLVDMTGMKGLIATILLLNAMANVSQSDLTELAPVGVESSSLSNFSNETRLVLFVESAVACARVNGKDMALEEFSNKTGLFVRGDLYIYAYDFNGTNIAHPFKTSWIGRNKLNETDSNGVQYICNLISVARAGNGFTYFIFPNPAHAGKDEFKVGYAMKVDDDWWLGSGLYLSSVSASFDKEKREGLVAFVEEALQFAKANGREKSLAAFSDRSGNFTRDGRYIFAYDYEGRTLADPQQPELMGPGGIGTRDPYGANFILQAIDTARRGNGFLYYIYPSSSGTATQTLMLSYIANVDDTWFIGSGIGAAGEA